MSDTERGFDDKSMDEYAKLVSSITTAPQKKKKS